MSVRERFWRREGERVEMFALISGPETSNKQVLFPGRRYEGGEVGAGENRQKITFERAPNFATSRLEQIEGPFPLSSQSPSGTLFQ